MTHFNIITSFFSTLSIPHLVAGLVLDAVLLSSLNVVLGGKALHAGNDVVGG